MIDAIKHKYKEFSHLVVTRARALFTKKGMIFQRLLLRVILSSVILVSHIPAPTTLLSGKLGSSPVARFYTKFGGHGSTGTQGRHGDFRSKKPLLPLL